MGQINQETRDQVVKLFDKYGGNVSAIARALKINRSTVYHYLRKLDLMDRQLAGGKVREDKVEVRDLPKKGTTRYIVTCAQNNTKLHKPVWENLLAIADHYDIPNENILVSSFTYNQNAYGELSVKRGTDKRGKQSLWYDPEIEAYLDQSDLNIELAPGLVWCGRMNTLPTATNPLSGFETYTGRKSGILPHVKLAMQSVFSHKAEATKFNYTTGTVTKMNYIQKRAGIRAERLHNYGALIVEVTAEGHWFVRQLTADGRNRIYDLGILAEGGTVSTKHPLEAITWGDIHSQQIDPEVRELGWGKGGMLDSLRPKHQFIHDLIDFRPRNHHDRKNPHRQFQRYVEGMDGVEDELRATAELLHEMRRDWCKTIVVDSNHDNALERWLRETDYRTDARNALFFLRTQLAKYEAIADGDTEFHTIEHSLRSLGCPEDVRFLREDESFITCRNSAGGIENGMHGHLGPSGMRGSPQVFKRMGRRQNTCHTHSAGIYDEVYVGGTSSLLDLGWNVGPSSWSHTHILTYANGIRSLATMWMGAWRG